LHDSSLNGFAATPGSRASSLAATQDPGALNVGLVARSCHESVITK